MLDCSNIFRSCLKLYRKVFIGQNRMFVYFLGNNIAVDPHSEKREDVMSTEVKTSKKMCIY